MDKEATIALLEREIVNAGRIALERFGKSRVVFNKERASVATDADLAVEKYLVEFLHKTFPDHRILAEESGKIGTESDFCWVIDPIDGTRYYNRGVPIYSVAVALEYRDRPFVGAIYFPSLNELYSAARDIGTRRNGMLVKCSNVGQLENALVAVEIPARHDRKEEIDRAVEFIRRMVASCQRVRVIGLSSFAMCQVAHGGFDAYVNLGSAAKQWDLSPGQIIAQESGARVSRVGEVVVVANPQLHRRLIDLLGLMA